MSLRIDEYLSSIGAVSGTTVQGTNTTASVEDTSKKETDSYISSVSSADEAIPCENYNDILKVIQSAKAEGNQTATSSETTEESGAAQGAGGGGGGGSEDEDETTTEVVTINGVTYLQTTTVTDGVTTVDRTVISGQNLQSKNEED